MTDDPLLLGSIQAAGPEAETPDWAFAVSGAVGLAAFGGLAALRLRLRRPSSIFPQPRWTS